MTKDKNTNLSQLEISETAMITNVGGEGALRQHFLDMGIIPGALITTVQYAPMGDPIEFNIHGYELTLRVADAEKIECEKCTYCNSANDWEAISDANRTPVEALDRRTHPGLGETLGTRSIDDRTKDHSHPVADDQILTFALAGNQNCGKTTLFNQLTGSNQHVGNFPGVTVDRKSGSIKNHPLTDVVDLPGIYSMSPYSAEEIVSREFILNEHPSGIINIIDATNIERNLYLTMQLMELDIPMVLALNMMDELQGNGGSIRINELENLLGIPVVPIAAINNEGVDELIKHALHVARYQEIPGRQDFCDPDENPALHRCLHGIMHLIEDHAEAAKIPVRFAATKVVEGDEQILERLNLSDSEKQILENIIVQMEAEGGLDRAAAIADMRYDFIGKVVTQTVIKPSESRERIRSRKIDRFLTGKYTAIPSFAAIMVSIFLLTFNVIGAWLQDLLNVGIDWATDATNECLQQIGCAEVLRSLVIDGIFNGVGIVVSFLPIIVTLFFFLSLLEDTGYMARVAFVMDKLLRRIGLSGRSIVPMLVGFGCTVPAVMASRTLPSERDRRLTIILTPFMSCATKITIYSFLTATFFPKQGGLIIFFLYFLGIAVGILTALLGRKSIFKGDAVPFVMELPNYRMPSAKSVGQLVWDKSKDFITRAFSVILIATIVVWFLQSFSLTLTPIDDPANSILAAIAGLIAPVFTPLGFGDWRVSTALIAGFMAKETVASTLSVLFGSTAALVAAITPLSAFCLLVFCLLYTPCVAAIASIKRELGPKWAAYIVCFQCVTAWLVAFVVRLVGMAMGFA